MRSEFHLIGTVATWLTLLTGGGLAQSADVISNDPSPSNLSVPFEQNPEPLALEISVQASSTKRYWHYRFHAGWQKSVENLWLAIGLDRL